jgi:hypothetical protein
MQPKRSLTDAECLCLREIMTTNRPKGRKPRLVYVEWDRCEETGRKLGLRFVVGSLSVLVRCHRPCPLHPYPVGAVIIWGEQDRVLLDTFPKPRPPA